MYIDPPVIDKGSFVPRPSVITRGNKRVKIGTPVYVHSGFDVISDCNIVNGTPPINITWFRNGSPYPTRGSVSTITITDASNGDVFKCRADNIIGFDTENTTIHVEYGKYICISCVHYIHKCLCLCMYCVLFVIGACVCACIHACMLVWVWCSGKFCGVCVVACAILVVLCDIVVWCIVLCCVTIQ